MRKNAFTLAELLTVFIILGIISLTATISYVKYVNDTRLDSYTQGEETMRAAAESFMTYCNTSTINLPASCPVIPDSGSSVRIEMADLIKEGFMDPITDQDASGTCDGYVVVHNNTAAGAVNYDFCYEVHLECSEYQTAADEWVCD